MGSENEAELSSSRQDEPLQYCIELYYSTPVCVGTVGLPWPVDSFNFPGIPVIYRCRCKLKFSKLPIL